MVSLRVTRDETMMVAVFVEGMPIRNHMLDAAAHSSAGPNSAMKEETCNCV